MSVRTRDPFPADTTGRVLPKYHRRQLEQLDQRRVDRAVRESVQPRRVEGAAAGGDAQTLRGIPVQARGVGGTSPGSNPLAYVLEREAERERGSRGRHLNQNAEHLNGR